PAWPRNRCDSSRPEPHQHPPEYLGPAPPTGETGPFCALFLLRGISRFAPATVAPKTFKSADDFSVRLLRLRKCCAIRRLASFRRPPAVPSASGTNPVSPAFLDPSVNDLRSAPSMHTRNQTASSRQPSAVSDLPARQGLYDPWFEHDACGVGFVVNMKG